MTTVTSLSFPPHRRYVCGSMSLDCGKRISRKKQSTEAGDHGKSIMENLSSLMDRITIGLRTGTKIKVAVLLKYVFFCRLMMQQERSLMLSLPITRELLQYLPSGNH